MKLVYVAGPLHRRVLRDMMKEFFKKHFRSLYYWWLNIWLDIQLKDEFSKIRTEAEAAVDYVVLETDLPPDCVSARVINGGCAIVVKHNDASQVLLHHNYRDAALEAVKWVREVGGVKAGKVSAMTRAQRNEFNARRKRERLARRKAN